MRHIIHLFLIVFAFLVITGCDYYLDNSKGYFYDLLKTTLPKDSPLLFQVTNYQDNSTEYQNEAISFTIALDNNELITNLKKSKKLTLCILGKGKNGFKFQIAERTISQDSTGYFSFRSKKGKTNIHFSPMDYQYLWKKRGEYDIEIFLRKIPSKQTVGTQVVHLVNTDLKNKLDADLPYIDFIKTDSALYNQVIQDIRCYKNEYYHRIRFSLSNRLSNFLKSFREYRYTYSYEVKVESQVFCDGKALEKVQKTTIHPEEKNVYADIQIGAATLASLPVGTHTLHIRWKAILFEQGLPIYNEKPLELEMKLEVNVPKIYRSVIEYDTIKVEVAKQEGLFDAKPDLLIEVSSYNESITTFKQSNVFSINNIPSDTFYHFTRDPLLQFTLSDFDHYGNSDVYIMKEQKLSTFEKVTPIVLKTTEATWPVRIHFLHQVNH